MSAPRLPMGVATLLAALAVAVAAPATVDAAGVHQHAAKIRKHHRHHPTCVIGTAVAVHRSP